MHTLPAPVVARIRFAVWQLAGSGRTARDRDVIGMLIMLRAPTTSRSLVRLLTRPQSALRSTVAQLPAGQQAGRLQMGEQRLWLELPVPVTHRLNLLVDLAHDLEFRTSRRQVVSALVLHRLSTSQLQLGQTLDRYRQLLARDARLPGQQLATVLDDTPPKPGRRAMR